ncbi:ATP-grasp domain-containing protein [Actinoplanes oblitus]|uniref:ATP-grasp domain-containing protein n=1 Tax=Actinoplanes oblitus TaxID=3040509 RepID=A0ABY8WBZ6_9ACTN|nr:ATP-grasp domain-containing protein [Actinoplanes oblitus]WIM95002.1 ATP-grasp domain-containing protein [Actinoplanes oblitus]
MSFPPEAGRPVLVVGYVGVTLAAVARFQAAGSVIYVEEPDVIRKRAVRAHLDGVPFVNDLIAWEYLRPGAADEFFDAHPGLDPVAVIPAIEYATTFAARLSERYGLPGAGLRAAEIMRDKLTLREVTRAAGIVNPASAEVTGPDDVTAFLAGRTGPVVLKPANRQASVGTEVIHDPGDVAAVWERCGRQDEGIFVPDRPMDVRMLVEEYVAGDEYSVEMLVRDGVPLFTNVTGKQLCPGPRPVELAHVVPADLPPEVAALLGSHTTGVVAATGFGTGIVHCEWILTDGTPYLVECAGRLPGDGIVDLIAAAYRMDLLRSYYALMSGADVTAGLPRRAAGGAAVHFVTAAPGLVEQVSGVEDARAVDGVFLVQVTAGPGDRVPALRSSWDRAGIVMATGADGGEALRRARTAADLVRVDTRPATDRGTLLVIGSGLKVYREYLVRPIRRRAEEAGLDMVLVNNLRPTWQSEYFDEIVVADVFDTRTMRDAVDRIAARRRIVALMCWDEPLVLDAGLIAAELGVPGLSEAGVQGCRDKQRTRAELTAAGLHQPAFGLTHTVEEARATAARIGYPVVLKPRAMGASIGVVLAADESELDDGFRVALSASEVDPGPYRACVIVEQYARGPEISVDGAVHKGEYLPMFVARKQSGEEPYFEETGHLVDAADPLLADRDLMRVLALAHRALGVEDGITHTELRLTAQGPLIIEVNGRLGGDLIPFLGRTATGIEPGEVLFDVATGQRPHLTPTRRVVAGIRFGYPEQDCVLRSVTVPAAAPGLVTAAPMAEPGALLRLPPGGYLARHSFVVCEADDTATCLDRLAAAAALVQLTGDPVGPPDGQTPFAMPAGLLDVDSEEL